MQRIAFENIIEKGELPQKSYFSFYHNISPKQYLLFNILTFQIFSMDVCNPDESVKLESDIEHVNKTLNRCWLGLNPNLGKMF